MRYLHRAGFLVLLCTIAMTLGWAVLMVSTGEHLNTIPTAYIIALFGQGSGAPVILVGSAVMAGYSLRHPGMHWRGIYMMTPQVLLVFMSSFSALFSSVAGHYPDGTVPIAPHRFITADHLLTILFAGLHAASVVVYHSGRWSSTSS